MIYNMSMISECVAKWLRHLTRKPKVRMAVGSNPTLDSLVAVRNTSPGRPEPCEGILVAVAGSCGGLMVKHPWPLLEISLSDFRGLATLNINTYLQLSSQLFIPCRNRYCFQDSSFVNDIMLILSMHYLSICCNVQTHTYTG